MAQKTPLTFLLIFLAFSSFLISSAAAVPTTRILKSTHFESAQDFVSQDARDFDQIKGGDSFEGVEERLLFEGRMVLENTDYPGTGANNHHDPRSPAKP